MSSGEGNFPAKHSIDLPQPTNSRGSTDFRQAAASAAQFNRDKIAQTGGLASTTEAVPIAVAFQPGGKNANWVLGRCDRGPSDTDPEFVENGLLFPYASNLKVFKCPADKKAGANGDETVRSMSMNAWMNPIVTEGQLMGGTIFRRQTNIRKPSETWVTIDENPNSINDGWFLVKPNTPSVWRDVPAAYHNDAGGLSFADGHAEIKKWTDQSVISQKGSFTRKDPKSDDLNWLITRTTAVQ